MGATEQRKRKRSVLDTVLPFDLPDPSQTFQNCKKTKLRATAPASKCAQKFHSEEQARLPSKTLTPFGPITASLSTSSSISAQVPAPAPTASHPLTNQNLYTFTYGMAPPTPKSASPVTPSNSPSKSSLSTGNKLPLHHILATNRMLVDDDAANEQHPQVLEWAEKIQGGKRQSAMKPESEKRLRQLRKQYEKSNELTFTHKFFVALIRSKRNKKTEDMTDWPSVEWDQDGLMEAWDVLFQKASIPAIATPDAATTMVLAKYPRIKNPKPDITFGLQEKEFSKELMTINRLFYAQAGICPAEVWHPFLIVEAKMKGVIEEAEYQCVRGGAALVNAARKLRYLAGADLRKPGADLDTPVFSLAVIPSQIVLHVHWAEVDTAGETWFHMHHVDTYAVRKANEGIRLRHDLDNILDWGTQTRKMEVITTLTEINTAVRKGTVKQLSDLAGSGVVVGEVDGVGNESNDAVAKDIADDNKEEEEEEAAAMQLLRDIGVQDARKRRRVD